MPVPIQGLRVKGERMRAFLQFMGVWGGFVALTAVTLAMVMWLLSVDGDPRDKRVASSFFWAMLWPIIWLSSRLAGKDSAVFGPRRLRPRTSTGGSAVGVVGRDVAPFKTVRDAKDFLAGKIVEEAAREGVPLTEVERKMLYFTETGWTLPDMKEVSSEFDRGYDQEEYERKIGGLATGLQARLDVDGEQARETWDQAIEKLSQGDHYMLVLINALSSTQKGARHNLKMVSIALVLFALAALSAWLKQWMRDH
jgi:hypothetical protein